METLLEIKDLSVEFKTHQEHVVAVDRISLKLEKGKTLGLVGESGSGKSITSLSVMQLIPSPPGKITSGQILFKGEDLIKKSPSEMRKIRGNQISMIFQEPMTSLNPVFTVGNQIIESLKLHRGMSTKEARQLTLELLDQVKIPHPSKRIDSYPHEMSGGQKQRAMIAMAMACEPDLLIADEPTTALDVTIQREVLDLMFQLQEKHKMSLLFITHDLGVIGDIADDVAVMYKGQIVENNSTENIFKNPQHPYTKGLLGCRPHVDKNPRRLFTVGDFLKNDNKELKIEVYEKPKKPETETLLEIQNLEKHFPIKGGVFKRTQSWVKAVDGVSFKLQRGKTLGLVGESGCGKTTLGRTIIRLLEPTQGKIIYGGKDITTIPITELRKLRRKFQIIFQDPYSSLNPRMTVGDILEEPLLIHQLGGNQNERRQRSEYLMDKVGLKASQLDRYPHEFSGGQRQRICIARALSVEPEFIICDESVSALDVSIQAQILNLLLDLQEELGLTYIFISHDLSVVNFISDDVSVMYGGKIIETGKASQIYHSPQNDYTRTLLEAIPKGIPKTLMRS